MRDGRLSYERFCMEAELLQRRSHELASRQDVENEKQCVATWEWRHGDRQHLDGNSFLVSSGNARQYHSNAIYTSMKHDKEMDRDTNELLLIEEYDWTNDDQVATTLQSQEVTTALLEFHIVYHTIYQTPVLYFRVSAVDGLPLPSAIFTHDVTFPGSNGRSTFVAMEEHPVLGKPFSFLHPCETAAAMQLLQAQIQTNDSTKTSSEVKVPRYLASWLSLVQPLTDNAVEALHQVRTLEANSRSRPKKSETARLYTSVQKRQENAVRTSALSRKRSRSSSRDSDEGTSRTKPPHRTLTMKTVLPPSINLPVPTKVSHLLKSPRVSLSHQKREVTEEQELVADLDATEPAFWIKRRKFVEAAMKELDSIGYVYTHLVQDT
ncbi:hypothetical protein KXD40_004115 [Peronospora effusa]|nr:hypothetical protein KXD40_004115 [Peronospora effusa]